ncbi:hypothetical protein CFK37_08275 [Virgibacillus phasianinus]|uniref:DUF1468 domain-containing protein n=1 Tax=Virgibacillus phasianinus TaxID=2017483 RepID=A0A220U237_9BACI|nr:tripartite tricarboxylate transporter TctB family protein [Virgibacillus phasianinus]ASK62160.1 hypothetical protein CFK37_08275 [Virgibacillus phasianinus]
MIKAKRDIINALVILALCVFAYYGSSLISVRNLGKTEASFFPNIVIAVLAFLGICLLVNSIYRMAREKNSKFDVSFKELLQENKKVIFTFAIFGVYVFLFSFIGYFVSTILFLAALYLLLSSNKQKLWVVLIGMVAFTFILYFIFNNALSVFLPSGVLF